MASPLSTEAIELLDTLSLEPTHASGIEQTDLRSILRGRKLFHRQAILSIVELGSGSNEGLPSPASSTNGIVPVGTPVAPIDSPDPNLEQLSNAPFLRLQGCHVIDKSGQQRPLMVGFLPEGDHGVLSLIHPQEEDATHNDAYNNIDYRNEGHRIQLTGFFASVVLTENSSSISSWLQEWDSLHHGWPCLAIIIEYLFLERNVSSLLLNWDIKEKSTRLHEAFKRIGKSAEMQDAAQAQSSVHNDQTIIKRPLLSTVQVEKGSRGRHSLLVKIPVSPARLAQVTGITYPK